MRISVLLSYTIFYGVLSGFTERKLSSIFSSGKKRTMLSACLASYDDSLDNIYESKNTSLENFSKTTLIIVPPNRIIEWRCELEEIGIKYVCATSKNKYEDILKSGKGKDPVVVICSVNIYRKFLDNCPKIWRRVVFASAETKNWPVWHNLKSRFFWEFFTDYDRFSTDADILNKTPRLQNNVITYFSREILIKNLSISYDVKDIRDFGIGIITEKENAIHHFSNEVNISPLRLKSLKETINKDFLQECSICMTEEHNKCMMICCFQMVCFSCLKSHTSSRGNTHLKFSCIFCRKKSSIKESSMMIQSSKINPFCRITPILSKIGALSSEKVLVITETPEDVKIITEKYSKSISYGTINTFTKLSRFYRDFAFLESVVVVLTKKEFSILYFHKIFFEITEIVDISKLPTDYVLNCLLNPGRNPKNPMNLHKFFIKT